MGVREDKTFLFVTIAVFVVAISSIVLMVGPIMPSLPSFPSFSSDSVTGQVFAVNEVIDQRYSPPWDLWDEELFFDVTQPTYTGLVASDDVVVTATIDRPGSYIRKNLYYYDGQKWKSQGPGGWVKDIYEESITFTVGELQDMNYVLAYTCEKNTAISGGWDCGCKSKTDSACRAYALQAFLGPTFNTSTNTSVNNSINTSIRCLTNADCMNSSKIYYNASKKYCRPVLGMCVECKIDTHCGAGKVCTNSVCVAGTPPAGCTSDANCSALTPKCNITLSECFECLIDNDCASTEYCDQGSCEAGTPSTVTDLVITQNTVLFQSEGTYDCGAGPSPASSPSISGFVYDEDTGAIYTNDHAGMTRFLVNKLQAPTVTIKDLHGASNSATLCQINEAAHTVSNCIGINGDTAGCVSPRTYAPIMDGEGVVHVETAHSMSHANSLLLYSDTDGSFDLDVEFGSAKGITTPFIVARGSNNGDAIVGGMPGFKGNYIQLFDTGSKRYGLLPVGVRYTNSVTLTNLRLIDLTNTYNPVDLGPISQYPDFYKLITPLCSASGSCYLSVLSRNMKSATPEKRTILKEGSQYVLYDYTDPTAVTELDRFSCNSLFCYEGAVTGLRGGLDAMLEGDTVYVHIPGGAEHRATVKKDYPELNPLKVNKCLDRATRPCYFGQVWKHKLGTNGWQKVVDVPGTLVQIRDGKLWLFGTGYGAHIGPDGIYDSSQLHAIPYSNNVYNANIFPGYRLKVYDLADGSELLHEELKVPVDVFRPSMLNSPSLAVMQENGKYYVYILYWATAGAPNHHNYLIGHEVSGCSGASCNVGTIPLTTTTGAVVTVGGSGGSGGGGGTPPPGGSCTTPCTGSGYRCGSGMRDCYAYGGVPGNPQCTYTEQCVNNCWTFSEEVCEENVICTAGQCGTTTIPPPADGDVSSTACTAASGMWMDASVFGSGTTSRCCGDDTEHVLNKQVERAEGQVTTDGGPAQICCPRASDCPMWTNGCAANGAVFGASNNIVCSGGISSVCNAAMQHIKRGNYRCCDGAWSYTTGGAFELCSTSQGS